MGFVTLSPEPLVLIKLVLETVDSDELIDSGPNSFCGHEAASEE